MSNENASNTTHIVAICGSMRNGSLTRRALARALKPLRHRPGVTVDVIDPCHMDLRFPGQEGAQALQGDLVARITRADGVLLATPEYHGSFSSVLKALLDSTGYPSALAGKPVALIGVAAGRPGAVKSLDHLRSVCAHMGGIVLPYPVSVPVADQVLPDDDICEDPEIAHMLKEIGEQLLRFVARHNQPAQNPLPLPQDQQVVEP